jgi:hypothetical protein
MTLRVVGHIRTAVALIQLAAAVFIPLAEARHAVARVAPPASQHMAAALSASERDTPPDAGCALCEYLVNTLGEALAPIRFTGPGEADLRSVSTVVEPQADPVAAAHRSRAPPERV